MSSILVKGYVEITPREYLDQPDVTPGLIPLVYAIDCQHASTACWGCVGSWDQDYLVSSIRTYRHPESEWIDKSFLKFMAETPTGQSVKRV